MLLLGLARNTGPELLTDIVQGCGQIAHLAQQSRLPLSTPGASWGCTGVVGCSTLNLFREPHNGKMNN